MFAPTLLSTKPLTLYNTCVNYVSFWYLNIFVCLFIKWVYNRCFFVSPLTIKQILFNKSSLQSVLIWTLTTSLMQHNMLLKSVMSYLFNLSFFFVLQNALVIILPKRMWGFTTKRQQRCYLSNIVCCQIARWKCTYMVMISLCWFVLASSPFKLIHLII